MFQITALRYLFCAPDRHFAPKISRLRVYEIQELQEDCSRSSPNALKLGILKLPVIEDWLRFRLIAIA